MNAGKTQFHMQEHAVGRRGAEEGQWEKVKMKEEDEYGGG